MNQVKLFLLLVSSQLAGATLHVVILTIIDERCSVITSKELLSFCFSKWGTFHGGIRAKLEDGGRTMANRA